MVAYTIFPFKASGVAPVFVSIEQDSDTAAVAEALKHLNDHSSECALWLAGGQLREVDCPAASSSGGVCPPTCRP